jgi:putative glycerol-1-phosphate prenyltransferase
MSKNILGHIKKCKQTGQKLLAILLDPDKLTVQNLPLIIKKINSNTVDFIFVGGSSVENGKTDTIVKGINKLTSIPIILFPGDFSQISNDADALLFLSLISGRNPEYLIGQQVKAVKKLKETSLEIISTGYILIDGGVKTSVQKISETTPISQSNIEDITMTAMAGELMGKQLIYLEAGSGAAVPADANIIKNVSESISIPLIVGGGIRSKKQLENAYNNGADIVVIGTAFEMDNNILESII